MHCFMPGNEEAEKQPVRYILGEHRPFYRCEEAIVYRMGLCKKVF